MPSSAGPNTAGDSNLVFSYDTGDTLNSYKGEPTTNQYTNSDFSNGTTGWTFGSWDGGRYIYSVENILGPFGKVVPALKITRTSSDTSYADFHQGNGGKYTSGNTYTLSAYVKGSGTFYKNTQSGFSGNTGTVTLTDVWQRVDYTVLSSTNSNYPYWAATAITQNVPMYFVFGQSEQKPHVTPYTFSSRSVTQGLVPLASNYTVDLTNTSYDSNAQISLDGSNDYIKVAQNANFYTNSWAWEMVVKFTSTIGTYQGLVWAEGATGAGSGYQYLLSLVSNSYFHYRINNTVTGWANTDTSSITFDPLKYNHIVWQFVNGITSIYVNGNLFHTDSTRGAYNGGTDSPLFIGARNDGALAAPIMPILYKFYNVPLIQSQITQNYLAYKTRFNLA